MTQEENSPNLPRLVEDQGRPLELDEQQQQVYTALINHAGKKWRLAEWYCGALQAVRSQGPDYLAQAANSIREISEKLPQLAGINLPESPHNKTKDAIAKILELKADSYQAGWEGNPINCELSEALGLLETLQPLYDAPPRTRMLQSALEKRDRFSGMLSKELRKARDNQFRELGKFFQSVTHHQKFPTHEEFLDKLGLFEKLLLHYLTPITAEQHAEIQRLIDHSPTPESEAQLKELFTHNSANLLFFLYKIENPEWLSLIEEIGKFKQLRDAEETADGGTSYRADPALTCLSRLAHKAPDKTLSILKSLPKSDNPHIPHQIMRCIAGIEDPSLTKQCLKLLRKYLKQSDHDDWIWIEEILKTWTRIGCNTEAIQLIQLYAESHIKRQQDRYNSGAGWQFSEVDRDFVEPLIQSHPWDLARVFFYTLKSWKHQQIAIAAKNQSPADSLFEGSPDDATRDPSDFWLEDFKNRHSHVHEVEEILATRLFEIGSVIFSKGDVEKMKEFDDMLRSDSWGLFNRLRWQLYADFPEHTLEWAKADFLPLIPMAGHYTGSHRFEMAQMLENQSQSHGTKFLSQDEIEQLHRFVMAGPINHDGELDNDAEFAKTFYFKQLHPIRSLLIDQALQTYEELAKERPDLPTSSYKPFSSPGGGARAIEYVAPKKAEGMADMPDDELWEFLNTWKPGSNRFDSEEWWVEENVSALGPKFTELLESHPERFNHTEEWWCNLTRSAILYKPLERATERITRNEKERVDASEPSENEWRNWFGLAAWIADWAGKPPKLGEEDETASEDRDWGWPRIITVKFLTTAITQKFEIPEDLKSEVGRLLRKLFEDHDPRLASKEKPMLHDWLTTAINSVRGKALGGLLELGVHQKKASPSNQPEEWIWQAIHDSLSAQDQSPAVFAIIGARLHPVLYLFAENIRKSPNLLMPPDNHSCRDAFVLAQVRYGNSLGALLNILPEFPSAALECLEELNSKQITEREHQIGDFGGRLGTHFAFYYWNSSFASTDVAESTMERYFEIADKSQRAKAISDISRIFSNEKPREDHNSMYQLVMELLEKRIAVIKSELQGGAYEAEDVHEELSAMVRWFGCECFPYGWRHKTVLQAIQLLDKAPPGAYSIRTLNAYSADPERLGASLEIIEAMLTKENEIDPWIYDEREMKPVLIRGIQSEDTSIRDRARLIQETLLRAGLFSYLELAEDT
mgnify:CR=1 FL=1